MAGNSQQPFATVELYTLPGCYACAYARRLLRRRGADPIEIPVTQLPGGRARLLELTGAVTVPQIVIDGEPVGGADAVAFLDRRGVLLPRLRRERFPVAVVRRRSWLRRRRAHRYRVELLDRDGRILERADVASPDAAQRRAATRIEPLPGSGWLNAPQTTGSSGAEPPRRRSRDRRAR